MSQTANVSSTASLIADPARMSILTALLDGRALPAGELAYAAGITAQTASSHLGKLLDGGLLALETAGRHRYYRLAGGHVSHAIEALAVIQPTGPVRRKAPTAQASALRNARCCYDHLAGRLGVALTNALRERRYIIDAPEQRFAVTAAGTTWFAGIGLDVPAIKATRRGLARPCLDWTERSHHLAGPLGVRLLCTMCGHGWLRRVPGSRAVQATPKGQAALKSQLGITDADWRCD